MEAFSPRKLVAATVEAYSLSCRQKGIHLGESRLRELLHVELLHVCADTAITPDVPEHVLGDRHRLRQVSTLLCAAACLGMLAFAQVMHNLVSNAEKFTSRGGTILLRIDVEPDARLTRHERLQLCQMPSGVLQLCRPAGEQPLHTDSAESTQHAVNGADASPKLNGLAHGVAPITSSSSANSIGRRQPRSPLRPQSAVLPPSPVAAAKPQRASSARLSCWDRLRGDAHCLPERLWDSTWGRVPFIRDFWLGLCPDVPLRQLPDLVQHAHAHAPAHAPTDAQSPSPSSAKPFDFTPSQQRAAAAANAANSSAAGRPQPLREPGACVRLRFSVRDTGVGISAADMRRLFLPFVQIEPGRQQQCGGECSFLVNSEHRLTYD